jgi:hypothetical protein
MPVFSYLDIDGDFSCRLNCVRCSAIALSGNRCRKRTCKSLPVCHVHLNKNYGLKILPSRIPGAGLGLFATKYFVPGQQISNYTGELITRRELDRRYHLGLAPYAFERLDRMVVDSACERGIASWINAPDDTNVSNAAFEHLPDLTIVVYAINQITPGDEILADYGINYFDGDINIHRTRPYT